jgi:hypothetical protein
MASVYSWNSPNSGNWETASNWTSNPSAPGTYPSQSGDAVNLTTANADALNSGQGVITLSTDVRLLSLAFGAENATNGARFSIIGNGSILFDSGSLVDRGVSRSADKLFDYVSVKVSSSTNQPIKFQGFGGSYGYTAACLTNKKNSIYQIARNGTNPICVAATSVEAFGIQHPTHIFNSTAISGGNITVLYYQGDTDGVWERSLWDTSSTAFYSGQIQMTLHSTGAGLLKIGRTGETFTIGKVLSSSPNAYLKLTATQVPSVSGVGNEFVEAVYGNIYTSLLVNKYGQGRWTLSGGATTNASKTLNVNIYEGILQIPFDKINAKTAFLLQGSDTATPKQKATLELSGSGTLPISSSVTFTASNNYGKDPNGFGGLRVASGSNITITSTALVTFFTGSKAAAAANATLTLPYFSLMLSYPTYIGGEGTVIVPNDIYAAANSYTLIKEDAGIVKMTTSDKTAAAIYQIDSGTLQVDGNNRIAAGTLVQVNNTATLQTTVTTVGNAINVKALTLAAGSTVMVGGT